MTSDLIDIGVNLGHKSFRADLDEVLHRAREAGVVEMVVTGTSIEASRRAIRIASAHDCLYATAGVHPHHASELSEASLTQLEMLTQEGPVVAVGECGLDYDRNFSPPEDQRRAFEQQLELAASRQLPVFLHERAAHADFRHIIERHRPNLVGGVVHCFTGDEAALAAYLALDLHIGVTGWICDERRGRHLLALVSKIPSDRLMIETDAPFLTPRTMRPAPRRNEPAFLPEVLHTLARARGEPPQQLALTTTETARRFFDL